MALLGNLLLMIACLLYAGLFYLVYLERIPKGGDGVMGYAWSVILICLILLVVLMIVSVMVAGRGGLQWVSESRWKRFGWISLAVAGGIVTTALGALFKYETGTPPLLRFLMNLGPVFIPPILIVVSAILLNASLRNALPVQVYKVPLIVVSVLSALGLLITLSIWMIESGMRQQATWNAYAKTGDQNTQRMLDEIDSCDVSKEMVFILVLTDRNQDARVREKALQKIKTHPDWQGELIRLLGTDWAPEVFTFLASNEVEDPARFAEPVNAGMFRQAEIIRNRIRSASHPSHFYSGLFSWEVERVLKTIERYESEGVDYLPALQAIRAAMEEPSDFDKPVFISIRELDKAIRKRTKSAN